LAYAWHVWRQIRNWKTTLAFSLGVLFGVLVLVALVGGSIAMAMYYLS
jgi:hypothetical protein